MPKDIYFVRANDSLGNKVESGQAEKGKAYFCRICSGDFVLKKSGNIGKGSKRPHFAHKVQTPNCTPETALHCEFKNLVLLKLRHHIAEGTPLPVSWNCEHCYEEHHGDWVAKLARVELEYLVEPRRPDLALFNKAGRLFAVVEIVVSHKPDEDALTFYAEKNIKVIQIQLISDEDLNAVDIKMSRPDRVDFCIYPRCPKCPKYQSPTRMIINTASCGMCKRIMKVATIEYWRGRFGPERFTEKELLFAKKKGVVIRKHLVNRRKEPAMANTCPKCLVFVGIHNSDTNPYLDIVISGRCRVYIVGYSCSYRDKDGK